MLNSLSGETQLILMVIIIATLFVVVSFNTKRNKDKLYGREKRNFKKNYLDKKRIKEKKEQ